MIKFLTSGILIVFLGISDVLAQGFTKDSLQFKVYTYVTFQEFNVKKIKIQKVFCDYCNEAQLKVLEDLARNLSNKLALKSENSIKHGEKRFVIKFRVAKNAFARMKPKDSIH